MKAIFLCFLAALLCGCFEAPSDDGPADASVSPADSASSGDSGPTVDGGDAGTIGDGGCGTALGHTTCVVDDVYAVDDCGKLLDQVATCADGCQSGYCCAPPTTGETVSLPFASQYLVWRRSLSDSVTIRVHVEEEIESDTTGADIAAWADKISGQYVVFRFRSQSSEIAGKAIEVVQSADVNPIDASDLVVASGGYTTAGATTISMGVPFDWKQGAYDLKIELSVADETGDWFVFTVTHGAAPEVVPVGSMRIPRASPNVAGLIGEGSSYLEIRSVNGNSSGPELYDTIPRISVRMTLPEEEMIEVRSTYENFGNGEFANCNTAYDETTEMMRLALGANVSRCAPAQTWLY